MGRERRGLRRREGREGVGDRERERGREREKLTRRRLSNRASGCRLAEGGNSVNTASSNLGGT